MYRHVYQTLRDQLRSYFGSTLQWIDLFDNQFDRMDEELPIVPPAVLIEFERITWTTGGKGWQEGEALLRIHIAQRVTAQSYASPLGPAPQSDAAMDKLKFLEDVHIALQSQGGQYFSPLDRVSSEQATNTDELRVDTMSYRTIITDCSVAEAAGTKEIQPGIDTGIKHAWPIDR
jgi:hypothetical protein